MDGLRVVGKIVKLERSILSWKEPFEVGKLEMKLERYVVVGKTICSWKDIDVVGKIRLGIVRVVMTYFIDKKPNPNPLP